MKVGLHTRLAPGHEDRYDVDHARVPDDLAAAMARAGIQEWHIWRSGRDVFHVVSCDDWEAARASLATEPAEHAWQETIGVHVVPVTRDDGSVAPLVTRHVWTLSEQTGGPVGPGQETT